MAMLTNIARMLCHLRQCHVTAILQGWWMKMKFVLTYRVMPQSHPTTDHARLWTPIRFLDRKAEWKAHRTFISVLFSWSHQAACPERLGAAVHLWLDQIIRKTPHWPRAMAVWASHGQRTGISNVFHIIWNPYGALTGPTRVPYNTFTDT